MKNPLIAFLAGIVLGSVVVFALFYTENPPTISHESEELLEGIIASWTAPPNTSEISQAFIFKLIGARLAFIPDTVRSLARRVDSLYHVPEGVVLAQWILESKWGLADLGANNYFGHTYAATKKFSAHPRYVWKVDRQYAGGIVRRVHVRFARYTDIAECFDVHGRYLSTSALYHDAFKESSPERFARSLAVHYAADPDYAIKLVTLMRRYRL